MSLTPNAPDAPVVNAAVLREIIKVQPFTRWTGLEILKAEAGEVVTRLELRKEDMTQHHGFLHGGLVGFLADNAAAYAAATLVGDVVTVAHLMVNVSPDRQIGHLDMHPLGSDGHCDRRRGIVMERPGGQYNGYVAVYRQQNLAIKRRDDQVDPARVPHSPGRDSVVGK